MAKPGSRGVNVRRVADKLPMSIVVQRRGITHTLHGGETLDINSLLNLKQQTSLLCKDKSKPTNVSREFFGFYDPQLQRVILTKERTSKSGYPEATFHPLKKMKVIGLNKRESRNWDFSRLMSDRGK